MSSPQKLSIETQILRPRANLITNANSESFCQSCGSTRHGASRRAFCALSAHNNALSGATCALAVRRASCPSLGSGKLAAASEVPNVFKGHHKKSLDRAIFEDGEVTPASIPSTSATSSSYALEVCGPKSIGATVNIRQFSPIPDDNDDDNCAMESANLPTTTPTTTTTAAAAAAAARICDAHKTKIRAVAFRRVRHKATRSICAARQLFTSVLAAQSLLAKCLLLSVLAQLLTDARLLQSLTPTLAVQAKSVNDVEIDWTLESNLFNKGDSIMTKYVRMKDVINIRCAPIISFKIYMVPKESALFCKSPAADVEDDAGRQMRQTVGKCAPNSSNPSVKVRSTRIGKSPVFEAGHSYFLITTSTGTSEGLENTEGGLCRSHGMRLRLVVVDEAVGGADLPPAKLTSFTEIFPNFRQPSTRENSHSGAHHMDRSGRYHQSRRQESPISQRQAPPLPDDSGAAANLHPRRIASAAVDASWPVVGANSDATAPADRPHSRNRHDDNNYSAGEVVRSASSKSSSDVFPAILTLEENGRIKTILVQNSRQLQEEINYASERNSRVQQIREYGTNLRHLPEYSMTGHGKINALPITINRAATDDSTGREASLETAPRGPADAWTAARHFAGSSHRRNISGGGSRSAGAAERSAAENAAPAPMMPAYSSSLRSNRGGVGADDSEKQHLPFTYVVGYNSADTVYGDDDVAGEPRASSAPTNCGTFSKLSALISLAALPILRARFP